MLKHWKDAHPEMENRPDFRIEVVASYRDALSRQLGEAVRIELRGGGFLNSKSEYSRCRVPRLTINKDEWNIKPPEPKKTAEQKDEEVLEVGGATWDISSVPVKRKVTDKGRKAKKRKLEPLVGWG